MAVTSCRYFTGYKPCGKSETCDQLCPSLSIPSIRLLVISLEAMGSVLRSTVILPSLKRKYPNCQITWLTKKPSDQMLSTNPLIDRILTTSAEDLLRLEALEFDLTFCLEKSLEAGGILNRVKTDLTYGFIVDKRTGAVLPATKSAVELWEIGISDNKKFFENTKSEAQLLTEALELGPYKSQGYYCPLTEAELKNAQEVREAWTLGHSSLIGINTGCSNFIRYRRFSIEFQRKLIAKIKNNFGAQVVLLGGPEESLNNQRIGYGLDVIQSPTDKGPRSGLVSTRACDIVVSGDSLGMHMAIAMERFIVAWFGPTCDQEIDLFGRGVKIRSEASCGPCWKRLCQKTTMCYDLVSMDKILAGIKKGIEWKDSTSSSKQPLSEISF